jgi:hypothetical protein
MLIWLFHWVPKILGFGIEILFYNAKSIGKDIKPNGSSSLLAKILSVTSSRLFNTFDKENLREIIQKLWI